MQPEDHDILQELQSLVAATAALVEWEQQLTGDGLLTPKPFEPVVEPRSLFAEGRSSGAERPENTPIKSTTAPTTAPTQPDSAPDRAPSSPSQTSAAETQALQTVPLDTAARLHVLAEHAARCRRCDLHQARNKSVFARGSSKASIVFVGEGPGADEDRLGEPFVGRAGELLDKMIQAMGFERDEVYICNVVKCRPPKNRTPTEAEAAACFPYLERQLRMVQPQVVVALGRCAAERLGLAEPGQSGWRGRWGTYQGFVAIPTYHPAYLLRSPEQKGKVWTDLKSVVKKMGRTLPLRR